MQHLIISGIDSDMSNIQPPGAEEEQISRAQLVHSNLSAFQRLIIRHTGKLNRERVRKYPFHKRRAVERIGLIGRSPEYIRRIQIFLPVGNQRLPCFCSREPLL